MRGAAQQHARLGTGKTSLCLFPPQRLPCSCLTVPHLSPPPEDMRESTKTELYYEDLEKLPVDEVARISEWLTEKVRSGAAAAVVKQQ
jgi:hypothetical protein